ncbi:MAG: Putative dehydrogenase [uncultured Thermomicrobiales bacterium]|uniref:Dehydrogenase n=1 Tax=uncultured Thermomicrobiales bacterium TaxID=1645740 RepID=A0A6J4VMS0_9BACT|nr:MAG: Putative dehydrogenase [uncultured Thermomicrobiales bacterium]
MPVNAGARPRRIALIGCGWAGLRHARGYIGAGAELRWLIDTDAERAEGLRRELGAAGATQVGTDYREALRDPATDAVDICLPHDLHAPIAIEATGAGKHVLCEKPLAATLEEADRMIAAAGRAGVVLMVAENVRFDPVFGKVGELLRDGVIGMPALVQLARECYLRASFMRDRPWFLDARAAAGGIMMSGGVHDFSLLLSLLGEVESVHALRAPQRFAEMQGDDTSVALVRFRNGAIGTLVESFLMKSLTTAAGPEIHTLRIDGDLGSLTVGADRRIRLFSERADYQPGGGLVAHEFHIPEADTFALEIEHFLAAIETGVEPLTSGRSQRAALACVLAAYRSMETGQPVPL